MTAPLWLDRETWSERDLKEVGTARYAEVAEDLLFAYAIGDGPARVWDCTAEEMHDELYHAMDDADSEAWAHNAFFDRTIHNGPAQAHLPRIADERWRCSMAMALSHALPGGLADLCRVLKVPADMAKLADGKKLVRLFTQPQPDNRKIRRATRLTHPAEWERFKQYAANDITAMRECVRRMPAWNWDASAIAEWHLDQRINQRGFQVDQALTRAGARAAVEEKARIATRFAQLSGGQFTPGQREKFRVYLGQRLGYELDNTQAGTFQVMLRDPGLPADVREMMELAIASNKTSTAKYAALDPAVSPDGRFRGGLQFAGASRTRRWAGRLFQPQNLPSRGLPSAEVIEDYIEHLKMGTHALFFDNLMLLGAAALRGCVVSAPGKKLVVADLSNIEGRVLADVQAWLGVGPLQAGAQHRRGALQVQVLPFVEQAAYDRLLWSCELNLVRGEDSFVRAQWAGRPMLWHIYPQEEGAHWDKLEAFLAQYCASLSPQAASALRAAWHAWNAGSALAQAWPAVQAVWPELLAHAEQWCELQAARPDLARRLEQFYRNWLSYAA